ncbi:MAG: hypothetical protein JWQ02_1608 [Capsulimonas sp.]|nr:hypothetical protein [Capsulimonas sp.]
MKNACVQINERRRFQSPKSYRSRSALPDSRDFEPSHELVTDEYSSTGQLS